jgi:hypothetical protein
LDCFNFAAPTVAGSSTVSSPQVGLIILDTMANMFKGYSSVGGWQNLTNNANVTTVTANYTATIGDDLIQDNVTGNTTVTLPSSSSCSGKIFKFKNMNTGWMIVSPHSGDTIDGFSSITLQNKLDYFEAVSNGSSGWTITSSRISPTSQIITSTGSGTYNTPAGAHHIRIRMVGGGGGGAGSGSASGGSIGSGGATSFTLSGTTIMQAGGGGFGQWANVGGAGGTASFGTGILGTALAGGSGQGAQTASATIAAMNGSMGGSSAFGGGGGGGGYGTAGTGLNGSPNTGGGGGGAGITNPAGTLNYTGSGGGSGAYAEAILQAPASSYTYVVGAGGTGGTAGTNGKAGGNGGSGIIIVEEFYQ